MESIRSADGSTIAFDRLGEGPPVILVGGATCTRGITAPLARALASGCTVVNPDRRGRGDSDDRSGAPHDRQREIEDLAALIEVLGGRASLYGHSSGAAVALNATVAGLAVDRLVLHDAPYNVEPDDGSRQYAVTLEALLESGRYGDAVASFLGAVGVPDDVVAGMRSGPGWSGMEAVAPSLAYDSAAMGDREGGAVPYDALGAITVPTLVLVGGADYPYMIDVARALHAGIRGSQLVHLEGAGHGAPPEVVTPALLPFLTGARPADAAANDHAPTGPVGA